MHSIALQVSLLLSILVAATSLSRSNSKIVLLDVDNTLYQEEHAGIEKQIVEKTHSYCKEKLGIEPDKADDLFREYGSTIEGLRQTMWKSLDESSRHKATRDFYEAVYNDIDMTALLFREGAKKESSTGYSHVHNRLLISRLLKALPYQIAFASNSPSWHVLKVLKSLGLSRNQDQNLFTPDRFPDFPTKHDPTAFFEGAFLDTYDELLFFDDSVNNLESVRDVFPGVDAIHVSKTNSLADALMKHVGLVHREYEFDSLKYLESKNLVDTQSINKDIWHFLVNNLMDLGNGHHPDAPIRIVDLGAGRLNILSLLMTGDKEQGLKPLFGQSAEQGTLVYTAYESNVDLLPACQEQLKKLNFELVEQVSEEEFIFSKDKVEVRLILRDFDDQSLSSDNSDVIPPNLIVGCCFADLFDPNKLVPALLRKFRSLETGSTTFVYFPITFSGTTQFLPPSPFEDTLSSERAIPSDTVAFDLYSKALSDSMGHNLDPILLQTIFEEHGAQLLAKRSSNWNIDPSTNPYLFETMMYFFGTVGGPSMMELGFDALGWIRRAHKRKPTIHVSNVDLLFQIGGNHHEQMVETCSRSIESNSMDEILFTAPREVGITTRAIPELTENQVLIESSFSLISSGTELKVFKGLFDDAALDVNIKGMEDERMAYPLAYGYCLVGRIIKCGEGVSAEKYLGKLAFTFSAHATHVVTDIDTIQLVPEDVSAEDAIFMPSIETALSVVHDAHVRVGENVAVFGQGLIGLFVTAILNLHANQEPSLRGKYGTITTFETLPDRLAASAQMGATQALLPGGFSGPFDVTIEVSGNSRALQSAIDSTSDGGRIIVGSWYGNTDVSLKLGMNFHRSHKSLLTSQVSEIPATMLGLWDKERRFGLAWELVRKLQPSRLLTKTTTLANAQDAYSCLEQGSEIAIAFDYTKNGAMF